MSDRRVARYIAGSLHPDTDRAVRYAAWAVTALCTALTLLVVLLVAAWASVHIFT